MLKYFAYGSNMNEKRMLERGITILSKKPAKMSNAKLLFNKIALFNMKQGYANIEICKKSVVEGVLYNIPAKDIYLLDTFEGFPTHYERWEVQVIVDKKIEYAITYVAHPSKTAKGLKPTKEYLNHLLAGKSFLSKEYFEKLKATPTAIEN